MSNVAYQINTPKVVHETIEGEVVIINLDSGAYYSLDQAGAALWAEIDRGVGADDLARYLEAHYTIGAADAAGAVQTLLNALMAEELVRPAGPSTQSPTYTNGQRAAYVAPALQKHTDMQDLLLLDPIHEVDETGWPSVKA